MASLRVSRRRDGSTSYQVLFRHAGRQTSATFDDRRTAERFRGWVDRLGPQQALDLLNQVPDRDDSLMTLGEHAARYIDSLTGIEDSTRARYHRLLAGPLAALAGQPLVSVDVDEVRLWVREQERFGAAPKTIANRHGLLSAILGDAVARGIITANPCARTRLPRGRRPEMVCLSPAEYALLEGFVPEHYVAFTRFLVTAGPRWSEATALTVADLRDDTIRISKAWKKSPDGGFVIGPPKTRRGDRAVALAPDVAAELHRLARGRPRGDLLFRTPSGTPVRHNVFHQYVWAPVVRLANGEAAVAPGSRRPKLASALVGVEPAAQSKALGRRPRIHHLRHTAASWMIAAGLDLMTVQYMLGHESITTTVDTYGHLLPERQAAASAAMGTMLARALAASEG